MALPRIEVNGRSYAATRETVVVVCVDGSEPAYHEAAVAAGVMPFFGKVSTTGTSLPATCAMPSFTNPNNMSIATGVPPSVHGISGNYFFDRDSGEEVMMNDPKWLRARTLFAEYARHGAAVTLVTAKDKLRRLLGSGVSGGICFSAEHAGAATAAEHGVADVLDLVGMPQPSVYSAELSEFVMAAGVAILERDRPDVMYLSLTDYIQHKHAPGSEVANAFYGMLDRYCRRLDELGCILVVTADHGMNAKSTPDGRPQVVYLQQQLDDWLGTGSARVILPITDPYTVHHGALGSFATVYLQPGITAAEVALRLSAVPGVELAVPTDQAPADFELPADRTGDLVVVGDRHTALGTTPERHDLSQLDAPLRSHGGLSEQGVPFVVNRPVRGLPEGHRLRNYDAYWVATNFTDKPIAALHVRGGAAAPPPGETTMATTTPDVGETRQPPPRRLVRMQWAVLLATMFCYLFFYTGRQTFGFAIPGIEAELDVSKTTLGWVSTALLWSYAVGQAINGNLADKFGGRRIMTIGAVASTVVNWVVSLGTSLWAIAVPWAANGYAQSMGWAAGGRVLSNWWPRSQRGRTYGFYVFAAGTGSVVAYATSVLVLDVWDLDWRWLFRIPVLLMLVGGITFFLVARNRPADRGLPAPADDSAAGTEPESADAPESSRDRYRAVLRHPKIWITGISIGFQNAARYGLLVWVPVYFLGADWKEHAAGGVSPLWITVALPVGMAIGALANGQISDRVFGSRRSQPIMVFMLLGAVCAGAMYLLPTSATSLAIAVLFLTGFFVYGPQASFWALCPDLVGARRSGTATGVVNFFAYLFAGFGEPLIGYVIDTSGNAGYVFVIVAGCCVASAAFAGTIRR